MGVGDEYRSYVVNLHIPGGIWLNLCLFVSVLVSRLHTRKPPYKKDSDLWQRQTKHDGVWGCEVEKLRWNEERGYRGIQISFTLIDEMTWEVSVHPIEYPYYMDLNLGHKSARPKTTTLRCSYVRATKEHT